MELCNKHRFDLKRSNVEVERFCCQKTWLRFFFQTKVWVVAKHGRLRLCEVEIFTEPLPTVTQVGSRVKEGQGVKVDTLVLGRVCRHGDTASQNGFGTAVRNNRIMAKKCSRFSTCSVSYSGSSSSILGFVWFSQLISYHPATRKILPFSPKGPPFDEPLLGLTAWTCPVTQPSTNCYRWISQIHGDVFSPPI